MAAPRRKDLPDRALFVCSSSASKPPPPPPDRALQLTGEESCYGHRCRTSTARIAVRAGAGMQPSLFLLLILSLLPPPLVAIRSGELGHSHEVTSTYRLTYRIISYLFVSILHGYLSAKYPAHNGIAYVYNTDTYLIQSVQHRFIYICACSRT
jgi:hypothetical protein